MSRARPYIAAGLDQQGRVQQTRLLAWEDDAGTCNTCPGELQPAECLQREPDRGTPPPVPWRAFGAALLIIFVTLAGVHIGASIFKPAPLVASR